MPELTSKSCVNAYIYINLIKGSQFISSGRVFPVFVSLHNWLYNLKNSYLRDEVLFKRSLELSENSILCVATVGVIPFSQV